MKTIFTALALCSIFTSSALAIPWPLGDGATGWESIFPVMRTYGNYDENAIWAAVTSSFTGHTFHNAIDISAAQAGTQNVRAVEAGVFTDCWPTDSTGTQWFVQIFPSGSSHKLINSFLWILTITVHHRIKHLSIAAQFCRKINLIETVNQAVPGKRKVDIGMMVQA